MISHKLRSRLRTQLLCKALATLAQLGKTLYFYDVQNYFVDQSISQKNDLNVTYLFIAHHVH